MSYLWKININQFNFIMITNREEVLENALRVFAKMNYEKASQVEIGKACGLTKAGLVYYDLIKLVQGCHPVGIYRTIYKRCGTDHAETYIAS